MAASATVVGLIFSRGSDYLNYYEFLTLERENVKKQMKLKNEVP